MLHQSAPSDDHHMQHLSPNEWNSLFSAPLNPTVFASLAANGVFPVPRGAQHDQRSALYNDHPPHSSWSHPPPQPPPIPSTSHHPHRPSVLRTHSSTASMFAEKPMTPTNDHSTHLQRHHHPHDTAHHARPLKHTDGRRISVRSLFYHLVQPSHPISRIMKFPCWTSICREDLMEAQRHFPLFIQTSCHLQPTISLYTIIPIRSNALMSVYLHHSGCHPLPLPLQLPCIPPYLSSPYPHIRIPLLTNFPPPLPQVPCPLIPNPLHSVIYSRTTSLVLPIMTLRVHLPRLDSLVLPTLNQHHPTMTTTQKGLQSKIRLQLKSGKCTQGRRRTSPTHREWRTYPGG